MKTKEVGIANLKAHLSQYIRAAQKGEEIIIKDRETPVAKLSPIRNSRWPFETIPATRPIKGIDEMVGHRPRGIKQSEVAKILADMRKDRMDEWLEEWLNS